MARHWRGAPTGNLVLFDLDNTLADRAGAFARWAARFAAEHGIDNDGVSWLAHEDQDGSTTEVRVTGRLRARAYTELTEALGGS
jgi:phosphoglycolate phosphatase-like HAD superfamily hydrolase